MALFNVRVYGLLINDAHEILITDEQEYGMQFTKFPGGGLEFGEGLKDGLKREFREECNTEIEVISHFYTTDFFVMSAFNTSQQIISVYYKVKNITNLNLNLKTKIFDFAGVEEIEKGILQTFRWMKLSELRRDDFTFPIDQHVAELLIKNYEFSG